METIRAAAFKLDNNIGHMGCQIETLFGARELLIGIKTELDDALQVGDSLYPITQINGKLNAILELMRYSLEDAYEAHENISTNGTVIFHHIMKEEIKEECKVDPAFKEALEKEHAKQQKTKKRA